MNFSDEYKNKAGALSVKFQQKAMKTLQLGSAAAFIGFGYQVITAATNSGRIFPGLVAGVFLLTALSVGKTYKPKEEQKRATGLQMPAHKAALGKASNIVAIYKRGHKNPLVMGEALGFAYFAYQAFQAQAMTGRIIPGVLATLLGASALIIGYNSGRKALATELEEALEAEERVRVIQAEEAEKNEKKAKRPWYKRIFNRKSKAVAEAEIITPEDDTIETEGQGQSAETMTPETSQEETTVEAEESKKGGFLDRLRSKSKKEKKPVSTKTKGWEPKDMTPRNP